MRGKDGSELAIAYIHGRIDAKIESTIDRELEIWSERFSLSPLEIKQRLGTLPFGAQQNSVPSRGVRTSVPTGLHSTTPALEVGSKTLSGTSAGSDRNGDSQDAPGQIITRVKGSQGGWRNKDGSPMTPEQRKKESVRRMKKRTDPLAKKILGAKTKTPKAKLEKQRFYQARSNARKRGLPLPPLPVENANP